jgi:hypothetical protein
MIRIPTGWQKPYQYYWKPNGMTIFCEDDTLKLINAQVFG